MNKEELIALSDLNREDNIKYISSEAQGIAITLDSDRYAPTLCKLERAYICGRRKSEEHIQQLEAQIETQSNYAKLYHQEVMALQSQLKASKDKYAELKKSSTKAKKIFQQAMESCHSSSPMDCIEWFADRIAELEKEIEELKKTYRKQRNKRIDDLQKKNAEMKKQLEMSNKVYNDNLDYSHHIEEQLTKAKELLEKWVELFKPKSKTALPTPIQVETEQFLSEVEK